MLLSSTGYGVVVLGDGLASLKLVKDVGAPSDGNRLNLFAGLKQIACLTDEPFKSRARGKIPRPVGMWVACVRKKIVRLAWQRFDERIFHSLAVTRRCGVKEADLAVKVDFVYVPKELTNIPCCSYLRPIFSE
jgi:hypothetical protein